MTGDSLKLFRSHSDSSKNEWGRSFPTWDEYHRGTTPLDSDDVQLLILGALQRVANAAESINRELSMTPYERELRDRLVKVDDDRKRSIHHANRILANNLVTETGFGWSRWHDLRTKLALGCAFDSLGLDDDDAADRLGFKPGTKIRAKFERWQKRRRKA